MTEQSTSPIPFRPEDPAGLRECLAALRPAGRELAGLPLPELLGGLEQFGRLWQPGSDHFRRACSMLEGTLSTRAVEESLTMLSLSLRGDVLLPELARELGRADLMDSWQADEAGTGYSRGYPLGVVAQVLAGNVFLGGAVAIAQTLLTRNAVLVKLSREDSGFTSLFAGCLEELDPGGVLARSIAVAAWSSEQDDLNQVLREEADGLVVWGGQAAIDAYPADRCRGRVIHYGPRLGVGLLCDRVDLEQSLPALAWDIALWEQRACSSPRLLLVEDADGSGSLPRRVASELSRALAGVREHLPARTLSLDEKSEVLSLREWASWGDRARVFASRRSMDHTVLLGSPVPQEIPLGYRTALVVPVDRVAKIPELLAPYRTALQTAVLAAPADRWPEAVRALVAAGMTQVVAAGSAASRFLGLPHEGEFALRRLVKLVGIDLGSGRLTCPGHRVDRAVVQRLKAGESTGR